METIVEFKAGLMVLADGRLAADSRKGLIRVAQDEAGLSHFCWFERDASGAPTGEAVKDIVIIPGECTFGKIPRPGSRVFELKFPEERHRNLFFWAQEASADQDDDYVTAVNLALNQELAESEEAAVEGQAAVAMEAEGPAAAAAAGGATAAPAPASAGPIGAADLAAVLGSILSGAAGAAGGLLQRRQRVDPGPTLADVLKPDLVAPLLRDPAMVDRLAPLLPEEHRSAEAISTLVSTPQFRHQLDLFSHALMTGQLDSSQFGLPPGGFGVLDFLRSIQQQADKEAAAAKQQQQGGAGEAQPQ